MKIICRRPLTDSERFDINHQVELEKIRAEADGDEPFSSAVFMTGGFLNRTRDGAIEFDPAEDF